MVTKASIHHLDNLLQLDIFSIVSCKIIFLNFWNGAGIRKASHFLFSYLLFLSCVQKYGRLLWKIFLAVAPSFVYCLSCFIPLSVLSPPCGVLSLKGLSNPYCGHLALTIRGGKNQFQLANVGFSFSHLSDGTPILPSDTGISTRQVGLPQPAYIWGVREKMSPSLIVNAVHRYLVCYVSVFFQNILTHYNHHTMFWIPKTKNFLFILHPMPDILFQ